MVDNHDDHSELEHEEESHEPPTQSDQEDNHAEPSDDSSPDLVGEESPHPAQPQVTPLNDSPIETTSSDFIDWDWERLKGDLAKSSEEVLSEEDEEEDGDRFRRLIIGEPTEPDDPDFNILSQRHPTGTPEKTGGWYAEDATETEDVDITPTSTSRKGASYRGDPADDTPQTARRFTRPSILPRRVPERDIGATQVSRAAYSPTSPLRQRNSSMRSRLFGELSGCGGCLLRMGILGLFVVIAVVIAIVSFGLYQYSILAASLPSVEDLQDRAAQFETTRILDRDGNLLYEILDPQAGRRTYKPMDEISPYMVAAIIATEDSQFYSHPGFDPLGIVRGYVQNVQEGEIVSGSSTITQQIARSLILDPTERSQRTALRKIREVLLAQEITRRYSKDEILELYLNQSYFGNLAYGVEAAAQTYFNTTAERLTLPQASFLAGLVQAPSVYDIFSNRDATLTRHQQVLSLMIETSTEQGCIFVSNNPQPICVSPEEAGIAAAEIATFEFSPASIGIRFPHWVTYIRYELEQLYDPQTIYRSGFTVYTTIDPYLQEQAQEIVQSQVESLADRNATDGALVAIKPGTGEILAMVGSADFYNEEIDGQVNMAIRPRQPGSSIKPITYTAAFEKGWTPATLIWDVYSEFPPSGNPNDPRQPYKPKNYDRRFHGPVTVRYALANSYNIPAVKTLNFVGVYDDPLTPEEDGFVSVAERMGITTLTSQEYGLALTLGGGEVTLLEMTSVYTNSTIPGKPFMNTRPLLVNRLCVQSMHI
jgi:membrane peptidoglycan carboxypeptidase